MSDIGHTLTPKGNGYLLTITGSAGKTVIHISERGALKDVSGAAITSSDVQNAMGALRGAGDTTLAECVQAWWETRKL